jgi:lysophospholipase L1-like esterase
MRGRMGARGTETDASRRKAGPRRRRAFWVLLACACAALSLLPADGVLARQTAMPPLSTSYLALGDDFAQGSQGAGISLSRALRRQGYVYQFLYGLWHFRHVKLIDLAHTGECTGTFISGGLSSRCRTKIVSTPSQLTQAVALVKARPQSGVKTITIDIGFNDLLTNEAAFVQAPPAQRPAILSNVLARLDSNWATIFTVLRRACADCNIIALNTYDPVPGGVVQARPAPVNVASVFNAYNNLLAQVAAKANVKVANIYASFLGHELQYTRIARANPYPTTAGYTAIARAVMRASGYPMP